MAPCQFLGQRPGVTTAQEATARHVRDALRALGRGHGIHWAADITTLPLRFVASVARTHGMADAGDEYYEWTTVRAAQLPDWAGKAAAS